MVDPAARRTHADFEATRSRQGGEGDVPVAPRLRRPEQLLVRARARELAQLGPERVGPVLDRAGQGLAVRDRRVERGEVGIDQGRQPAPPELAQPVDVRGEVGDPLLRGREAGRTASSPSAVSSGRAAVPGGFAIVATRPAPPIAMTAATRSQTMVRSTRLMGWS